MGQLVFQATAGGQVALVGPNPTSNFSLNVPAVNGNLVTTGDTGTVTNTMLASSAYTAPGTIGSGTPNSGAFTTLSASSTVSGTGFSTYLASPPAIGGTSPSTGKFTSITNTGLTATQVIYATTGGLETSSSNLTFSGTVLTTPTISSPSATAFTLQSAGTTAVTIDTSQNVGIGTTSPSNKVEVTGAVKINAAANGTRSLYFGPSGGNYAAITYDDSAGSLALGTIYGYPLIFNTNNAERMRIDSSGNVGIGTSTIGTKLNVLLGTSYTIGSNWNTSVVTFGQAISSGGVAGGALGVSFDTTNGATLSSLNPGVSWYQMQLAGTYIAFRTGGSATEAARIDGSGNLLVGTTAAFSSGLTCIAFDGSAKNGLNIKTTYSSTGSGYIGFYNSAGTQTGYISQNGTTTVNYVTSSDYRLKENIVPLTDALVKVAKLKPVTYTWKDTNLSLIHI